MFYKRNDFGFEFRVKAPDDSFVAIDQDDYLALIQGQQSGKVIAADEKGKPVLRDPPALPPTPVTLTPRQVIETLFTPAEQKALFTAAQTASGWQIAKFISLVTATPLVSVVDPDFVADVGVVEAAGILTAARATQVLAGTPAPAS